MDKHVTFQQGGNEDFSTPWPVTVDENGDVQFMEEYGIERKLIFFQEPDVQSPALWFSDFWDDPDAASGLVPVYTGPESPGGFFSIGNPVVSVKVLELA